MMKNGWRKKRIRFQEDELGVENYGKSGISRVDLKDVYIYY